MPNTRKQLCWARLKAALLCQGLQACLARTAGGGTESVPGKSSPGHIVFFGGGRGGHDPWGTAISRKHVFHGAKKSGVSSF